jgi:hypothetical protein
MEDIKKVNVEGGELTFMQRIELGKIIGSEADPCRSLRDVMRCLHGVEVDFGDAKALRWYAAYFEEIVKGIAFWCDKEKLLKYEPTPEEARAGIEQLSRNVGEYGTLVAIARSFAADPDEVLKWEYGKVFGILYTDCEQAKFQRRYQKIIEQKSKVGKWRAKR